MSRIRAALRFAALKRTSKPFGVALQRCRCGARKRKQHGAIGTAFIQGAIAVRVGRTSWIEIARKFLSQSPARARRVSKSYLIAMEAL